MALAEAKYSDRKGVLAVVSLFTILSIALGLVSFVAHQKLTVLEARITELQDDREIPGRLKRHIDGYFNTEFTNSKWRRDVTSQVEPLIRDLVTAAVKNLEKVCGKSNLCQSSSVGKDGNKQLFGLADSSTACCERLAAPILQGPNHSKILATAGKSILLPCVPSIGYPTPLVKWDIDHNDPEFVHNRNGLFIPNAQGRHERSYVCTVSNIFGVVNKTVDLEVRGDIKVNITVPREAFIDGQTKTATLVCEFTGVPTPTITWRHLGLDGTNETITKNIQKGFYSSTLAFTKPMFLDSGVYKCTATNRYESVQSFGVLEVRAAPVVYTQSSTKSVVKGSDVTLDCIVISNPIATVTWVLPVVSDHKPFNVFDNGDGSITIRDAVQINEGDYTCVATNSYGSDNSTTTVDVIEPVTVKIADPRHPLSDSVKFVAMDCRATGDPTPSITWNKLGAVLDTVDSRYIFLANGDFIISSVTPATFTKDSGVYTCTATNGYSNSTAYAIVYFDHGTVSCNDTFFNYNTSDGEAHGVKCPAGCLKDAGDVGGSNPYSKSSRICKAAIHRGVIAPDLGGLVLWYIGENISTNGSYQHGVQSIRSSILFDVVFILDKSTRLYSASTTTQLIGK